MGPRSARAAIDRTGGRARTRTAPTGGVPIGAVEASPCGSQGQFTSNSNFFTPTGTYTDCDAPPATTQPGYTPVSATV